jgi:exodeoxyribonuclease-3
VKENTMPIKVYSWNVNGLRAQAKKGFLTWLEESHGDVVFIQEVKAQEEQLEDQLREFKNYKGYWHSAQKKGYSGVGLYTKLPIDDKDVIKGLGIQEFDDEGRVIGLKLKSHILLGCYFPNSQAEGRRLDYKIRFCDAVLKKALSYTESGYKVVISGDLNIAHKEIDLARPEANQKSPGFLPEERAWFTKALSLGFIDAFRLFNKEPNNYTWWSMRTRARERNVGWRIDTQLVSNNAKDSIVFSKIHSNIHGSDHCPISIEIKC